MPVSCPHACRVQLCAYLSTVCTPCNNFVNFIVLCLHADLAPLKCSVLVLTEGPACVESVSVGEIKL